MKTYVVTRHLGALKWLESQGIKADTYLTHLTDVSSFEFGDMVIGVLPLPIVAKLNQKGVAYFHFTLDIPLEYRGMELCEETLQKLSPRLEQFEVSRPDIYR
ncbi:CRISPR-associated protein Csx16 [Vibrio breoganii]